MKEDYADMPGCHGKSTFCRPEVTDEEQIEEIKKVVKLAHDRGWQIGVHAIGNKAAAVMTDAFIEAQQENLRGDVRHYLIHSDGLADRKSLITGQYRRQDLAISVTDALKEFTMGGAWQEHAESWRGSIEVNKVADFTIIDKDIFEIPVEEISTINAAMTVVDGKIVYAV